MQDLVTLIFNSIKDVLRPRIMLIMTVPFLGAFAIWGIITWILWDWISGLGLQLYSWVIIQKLVEFLSPYFVLTENPLVTVIAAAFILIVIFPAALITALIITSLILVPVLVKELRLREFPQIKPTDNSIFAGFGTTIGYSIKYIVSWVVSLPLWFLIPGGALFIPFLLVAWFNSRLFTWEVMVEIAARDEIQPFVEKHSRSLFLVGLITSIFYYIPVINIVAPVVTSAAYARFCLQKYALMTTSPQKNPS